MDKQALSKAYQESEWDGVRKTLENYLRAKDEKSIDVEERIFAYKHLGVIFASDSNTYTRAESYFNRLLDLAPNIEIVDMYVSKKVSEFFRQVKEDYRNEKNYSSNFDELGRLKAPEGAPAGKGGAGAGPGPQHPAPRQGKTQTYKRGNGSWVWWTVGLAAAAGVGAGVFYLTQDKAPVKDSLLTDVTPDEESRN